MHPTLSRSLGEHSQFFTELEDAGFFQRLFLTVFVCIKEQGQLTTPHHSKGYADPGFCFFQFPRLAE